MEPGTYAEYFLSHLARVLQQDCPTRTSEQSIVLNSKSSVIGFGFVFLILYLFVRTAIQIEIVMLTKFAKKGLVNQLW